MPSSEREQGPFWLHSHPYLADGLEMRGMALHLLGERVNVAKSALERL